MEENTITRREQLLVVASAIILAGMAANYSTISPSSSHSIIARALAEELLENLLH